MRVPILLAPIVAIGLASAQTQFARFVRQHLPLFYAGTTSNVFADVDRDGGASLAAGARRAPPAQGQCSRAPRTTTELGGCCGGRGIEGRRSVAGEREDVMRRTVSS